MLNRTHAPSRILCIVFMLTVGLMGTLVALADQGEKVSEIQIPPRRQNETAAAYNRRVSIARNAAARRLASDQMPKMYDKQIGETDTSYQERLRRTVIGLLSLQTPDVSHHSGESQEAYQAHRRSSAPTEYAFLVARPGEEETAYMSRLTAWKGLRENTKRRPGKTEALFKARLRAKAARLRAKAKSLDSEIVRANVDLLTEQERAVVDLPFETSLSAGGVFASRRTYCNGHYGISDIGPLRIAVNGLKFSGKSTSESIMVKPSQLSGGGSGATGTGNRRFTYTKDGDRTLCTFGGIEFSFVDGKMVIGDAAISFEKATTVFLSREGHLQKLFRAP